MPKFLVSGTIEMTFEIEIEAKDEAEAEAEVFAFPFGYLKDDAIKQRVYVDCVKELDSV